METRIDVQERIERIIELINGRNLKQTAVPERHLLCVMFGGMLNEGHEVCRQLHQSFSWRYHRGMSLEPFQMLYLTQWNNAQADEAFEWVKHNISRGFLPSTNQYYIPVIFLMQDPDAFKAADFIKNLRAYLKQEGIGGCEIDLYGLIDYSKQEAASNWAQLCPLIKPLRGLGYSDLYLLTKDEMNSQNIFSKALDALEMNIFLKVSSGRIGILPFWRLKQEESPADNSAHFKVLSYWKMDILVCTICRYVQEILDYQLTGAMGQCYQEEIKRCLDNYYKTDIEDRRILELAKHLPVDEADVQELQSVNKKGILAGILKKQAKSEYTGQEVLDKLYGTADFLDIFAKSLVPGTEEAAENLAAEILKFGTLQDVEKRLSRILQEELETAERESEELQKNLKGLLGQPVSYGTKDFGKFLDRLFAELAVVQYQQFAAKRKSDVLNGVLSILDSEAFRSRLEEERQKKQDRIGFLNAIIGSNMPRNGGEMEQLMAQHQFYDHKMDMGLSWHEDVFDKLFDKFDGLAVDKFRLRFSKIAENIREFEDMEKDEILRIFEQGIKRLRDGMDTVPLYILHGQAFSLEQYRREFLFSDHYFISDAKAERRAAELDTSERIQLVPNEASAPFTIEFFGINDSANAKGITGLYKDKGGEV